MKYFDHAATSSPKPAEVAEAVGQYLLTGSFAAGRGSYQGSVETGKIVHQTRMQIAHLFNAEKAEKVIFCHNGTDALNMAIQGIMEPECRVLTTVLEHNSVLRPLKFLEQKIGIKVSYLSPEFNGKISLPQVQKIFEQEKPAVFICSHASNVTGILQPIAELGELCEKYGVIFLLDAAQSAGHVPIDIQKNKINMLATSGHKGLLGPLGMGLLVLGNIDTGIIKPLRFGGTGSQSESPLQPETLPDKFEAGNLNVAGIVGLHAALKLLTPENLLKRRQHELQLLQILQDGLKQNSTLKLLESDANIHDRVGVISVTSDIYDPQTLAQLLDVEFGIAVRAGFHCAPLAHDYYKTISGGGTTRISIGYDTTPEDVQYLIDALRKLAGI